MHTQQNAEPSGGSQSSSQSDPDEKIARQGKTGDPSNMSKGRIERWSDLSTGFRTLALNLGIFTLACLLAYIYVCRNPPTIVIGNIEISDVMLSQFLKTEELHSRLTQAFRGAYRLGGDAMPEEVVTNSIEDEANQLDFEIPDIGLSFSKLINYLPKKLGFDRDATVTGKLAPTDDGEYLFRAELTDHSGPTGFEGTDSNLDTLLLQAASELLRERNPYVYASSLSVKERSACYADIQNCDFPRATLAYQLIYESEPARQPFYERLFNEVRSHSSRRYIRWALLAASKIHEDQNDYAGEIELARRATDEWPRFSWGYYNWGVALAELGCFHGAINAFSKTISLQDTYAAAYNARGRIHLFRAESLFQTGDARLETERRKAMRDFLTALSLNSDYAEAQINLGKTHRLDATENRLARVQFEAVVANAKSPHTARAYQQLAIIDRLEGNDAKYLDNMGSARRAMATNTVCGHSFSNSLRDASGCMEKPEETRFPDLSTGISCKRHSESLPEAENDDL